MRIKKYLPFEDYVLTTPLSPQEVQQRLANNIDTSKGIRLSLYPQNTSKPYKGRIDNNQFTITRIIHYRNSFLPIVKGTIATYLNQTQVSITMKPPVFALVFMCIWMGIVALACIGIVIAAVMNGGHLFNEGIGIFAIIPFAMLIFGALLTYFAFKSESKKARKFLAHLLQGQESNATS